MGRMNKNNLLWIILGIILLGIFAKNLGLFAIGRPPYALFLCEKPSAINEYYFYSDIADDLKNYGEYTFPCEILHLENKWARLNEPLNPTERKIIWWEMADMEITPGEFDELANKCINEGGNAGIGISFSNTNTPCPAIVNPPTTKYKCLGNSCIESVDGTYTTSNCNNECTLDIEKTFWQRFIAWLKSIFNFKGWGI